MTPAKLAANRANARLSTGPRTPEGKARSSQNATTWGFTAALRGMPPDWHEAALVKAVEISSEFSDPTERALVAQHVYLIIWRRYIAWLEAEAFNQFDNWLEIFRHPTLYRSLDRACARADHLARRVELSLARYHKTKNTTTNPYLPDSTTPPLAMRAPASKVGQASACHCHTQPPQPQPVGRACNFATTIPYHSDSTAPVKIAAASSEACLSLTGTSACPISAKKTHPKRTGGPGCNNPFLDSS